MVTPQRSRQVAASSLDTVEAPRAELTAHGQQPQQVPQLVQQLAQTTQRAEARAKTAEARPSAAVTAIHGTDRRPPEN